MRKTLLAVLNIVVLLTLVTTVYRLYEISNWNAWVNKVMIVGQRGSSKHDVERILGRPTEVRSPKTVGSGFLPRPPDNSFVRKVYVYKHIFLGMGGYWVAFVYLDEADQVVAIHVAES